MKSGIYKVFIGPKFYIGQTGDLQARKSGHLSYLRRGAHPNAHMQRAFNRIGTYRFVILGRVLPEHLNALEQALLDLQHADPLCLNIAKDVQAPGRGLVRSRETLKKISQAAAGRTLSPAIVRERKRAKETRCHWEHSDHGVWYCNRWELCQEFGALDWNSLGVVQRYPYSNSHKGWRKRPDIGIHLYHPEHGIWRGTQRELVAKYGGDPSRLSKVKNGHIGSHRGWVVRSDIFA